MSTTPGSGEPDDRDEFGDPQSIDAAFDEIVANIDHPDTAASTAPWPEAEEDQEPDPPPKQDRPPGLLPNSDWSEWDDVRVPEDVDEDDSEDIEDEDEGHYVPPPPPPVPKGDKATRWAWAGALGAPALAIVLPLIGFDINGITGLLLVAAFLAGFIALISRLRPGPRIDDGPDDGAVV